MKPAGWFAHPVLSLMVAATWLLLQQSLAPAALLWAAVFALAVPRLVHGFLAPRTRLGRLSTALRFAAIVLWDIVVANLVVARIVLDPRACPQPAWVAVPLTLVHPTGVTLLAAVVTTTPGTVSCVVDLEGRVLHVHALDCADATALADDIRRRYEAPLKEIFE
jgi:multicomponent K+:H+ antiporter subunit E